jgi:hypothetical protein
MHCADAMKNFAVVYLVRERENLLSTPMSVGRRRGPGRGWRGGAGQFWRCGYTRERSLSFPLCIRAGFVSVLVLFFVRVCVVRVCLTVIGLGARPPVTQTHTWVNRAHAVGSCSRKDHLHDAENHHGRLRQADLANMCRWTLRRSPTSTRCTSCTTLSR